MQTANLYDANYSILTREQFVNDFPSASIPEDIDDTARALAFYDDEELLIAAFWAPSRDFATFTADLAKYAASQADPGEVLPKVGRNVTELAGR